MKKIIVTVFSLVVLFVLYLYFFLPIPSFSNEEVVKRIKNEELVVEWKRVRGVLDQNFPDFITVRRGGNIDTICKSHNIADLELCEKKIKLDFHDQPIKYDKRIKIPKESFGYIIEIKVKSVKKMDW